jgi:predicted nucleic acid-binding protein
MAQQRFYFDTSIFIDYYENRNDTFRPLGEWAFKLLQLIQSENHTLLVSDRVLAELSSYYKEDEIKLLLKPFWAAITMITATAINVKEAAQIACERNLPKGDAIHALLAKEHNAILISRDRHFEQLRDIANIRKPEEII